MLAVDQTVRLHCTVCASQKALHGYLHSEIAGNAMLMSHDQKQSV